MIANRTRLHRNTSPAASPRRRLSPESLWSRRSASCISPTFPTSAQGTESLCAKSSELRNSNYQGIAVSLYDVERCGDHNGCQADDHASPQSPPPSTGITNHVGQKHCSQYLAFLLTSHRKWRRSAIEDGHKFRAERQEKFECQMGPSIQGHRPEALALSNRLAMKYRPFSLSR